MSHHPQANNFFDSSVKVKLAFFDARIMKFVRVFTTLYAFLFISFYAWDKCFSPLIYDTLTIENYSIEIWNNGNLINHSLVKIFKPNKPNFSV